MTALVLDDIIARMIAIGTPTHDPPAPPPVEEGKRWNLPPHMRARPLQVQS